MNYATDMWYGHCSIRRIQAAGCRLGPPFSLDCGREVVVSTLFTLSIAMYIGPDVLLPLASVFGAIAGVVMIFWRQMKAAAGRLAGVFSRKS